MPFAGVIRLEILNEPADKKDLFDGTGIRSQHAY